MALNIFFGIVIVAIAIPVLLKISCWIYSQFLMIRLSFMTIEQQEEYFEKEYELFQNNKREYPEQFIQSLKSCCESWLEYWSQDIEKDDDEEQEFQELLDYQKERIEFWEKAIKSIDTEMWYRTIRNSNK